MDEFIKEFATVLAEEENLLDCLTEKQKFLRKAVMDKNWEDLVGLINEVNLISDSFQKFDIRRDEIQEKLKTEELKPYFERLGRLRTKLLKCKVENQVFYIKKWHQIGAIFSYISVFLKIHSHYLLLVIHRKL